MSATFAAVHAALQTFDPTPVVDNGPRLLAAVTADTGKTMWDTVKGFIEPIILAVIAVIAITFLVRRQVSQFVQFLVLGIGIMVIFEAPSIIKNIAQFFADKSGAGDAAG